LTDPALDTLLLPFATGALSWPGEGRVLFLGARAGAAPAGAPADRLVCVQTFKPFADALTRAGLTVETTVPEGQFPLVLVLPPRQREAARALLARAVAACAPGGMIVAAATNTEGAKTMEADLAQIAGPVYSLSKNKARVAWAVAGQGGDADLCSTWADLDAPRTVADGRFVSRPGLFAWDRIDPGTALLIEHLPRDLKGKAADLGAGVGVLSAGLLDRCRRISLLDLYEADANALDLARRNLADRAGEVKMDFHWHDVPTGLHRWYEVVVMNPPFHTGRADEPDLGQGFIRAAAKALVPGGRLWMVANRHLPYEKTLAEQFRIVTRVAESDGYKVIEAVRGAR